MRHNVWTVAACAHLLNGNQVRKAECGVRSEAVQNQRRLEQSSSSSCSSSFSNSGLKDFYYEEEDEQEDEINQSSALNAREIKSRTAFFGSLPS
jgi:U3 small nucleolar RNA-associated protein 14